ncbi:hypothetical protein ACOSQ4_027546 [Xanthoceras sorbifolium]
MRKIFIQELMSKTSLDACHALRRQEIREMVKDLYAKVGSPINIGDQMFLTLLNMIMSMSWGGSLHKEDKSRVGIQFRQMVGEYIELCGAPNISDFFPVLARFDLQGVESKMKKLSLWFDKFFESLIDNRMKDHQDGGENKKEEKGSKDFLETLLELTQQGDDKSSLSMNQVKAILLDLFLAGTHTSSTTIEWVMAELLQHPETILRKACKELEEVVGIDNIVEEFHIPKLHYLNSILKETFRLHPPGPLLLPRSPCTTQTVSKYTIPKGSRVLFNVWAMHRDPEAWESPLEFQPERFLRDDDGKYEYKGNNFNLLPFGSGRRICAGIPMAEKMILHVLATLLHSFEWKLPEGSKVDLSEKFGFIMTKQEPLILAGLISVSWWSLWWDGLTENPTTRLISTLLAATILAVSLYAWLIKKPFTSVPPLPPGPPGLPLLGNLPFLPPDLHRYVTKLSEIYGPIMKLQLGGKVCIVISSTSLAKQALKDHDTIFANRDPTIAALVSTYGGIDLAWSPYGPEWRKLRRIIAQELMSKTNLDACHALRRQEIRKMVREVYAKVGSPINIGDQMFLTVFNVITRMSWGGSEHGEDGSRVGIEFRQMGDEFLDLWGAPNISDIFPVLARFDLQGVELKMKKLSSWFDRFFESLIDSRTKDHQDGGENKEEEKGSKDFLEILLELMQQEDGNSSLTMNQVKGLLLDNFLGGTHTSSAIIEWIMAELLQHPKILRKACKELEEVVGNDNIVEEFHIPKLHYLTTILKEAFRLYPPVPLLPRTPSTTLTISEYTIPKGSRIFFNLWAMQRDPKAWESPLEFQPERFLRDDAGKGDYQGNNFNFLPFGSGRRICPGIPLGEKMVLYVLATLLHSFEWKLPEGSRIDLADKFGLALNKQEPLIAIPAAKLSYPQHYY